MSNADLFKTSTQAQTAQQLADSIPQGRAWAAKNVDGSNCRKLINSLAVAHNSVQQQVELLADEFQILQSVELLTDWEGSVGLPGECLGTAETLVERREKVINRLRKQPIVSLSDFQTYLDELFPDLGLIVIPGSEYFTLEYDLPVPLLGDVDEKFILVITIPVSGNELEYDLEIDLEGGTDVSSLECILQKIAPANVLVMIENVG